MNLTTFLKPKLFLTDSLFYAVITPIIAYFFIFLTKLFLISKFYLTFNNTKKNPIFQMGFLKIKNVLR
jgi:hypothetical protein